MRKKYWRHIPCATILILLSSVGIATAQTYPEIVIPVSDTEARRVIELDRGWEMRYEIASWQSKGRIRIAKINGETLALAGELVQFTPFDDADPIVVTSNGLEPTEHAALFMWSASRITGRFDPEEHGGMARVIADNPGFDHLMLEEVMTDLVWNENNVSLKIYPVYEASADDWYLGGGEKPEEVDRVAKAYGAFGAISTAGMGRLSKAKPLNGHHYRIRRLQNNSAPEYVMIFEPVRQGPKMMIDDMRSVAEREADYNSPKMVAHRKTEAYRLEKENRDSYKAHMEAAEARIQARGDALRGHE